MFTKASLLGLALGAVFVLGGATTARADNFDRGCENRIRQEQRELNRAIYRHGYWSRQAQKERKELNRLVANCRRDDRRRDNHRDRDGRWNDDRH